MTPCHCLCLPAGPSLRLWENAIVAGPGAGPAGPSLRLWESAIVAGPGAGSWLVSRFNPLFTAACVCLQV
jgi:hypothetical protein